MDRDQHEQQTQHIATRLGARYADVRQLEPIEVNEDILTFDEIERLHMAPLARTHYGVAIGYTEHTKQSDLALVKQKFQDQNLDLRFISEASYQDIYQRFKTVYRPEINPLDDLGQPLANVPIKHLLEFIVTKAYRSHASDIHIEPDEDSARVRFRVDGRLQPIGTLDKLRYRSLLGDIKIKGNVNVMSDQSLTGHINMDVTDAKNQTNTLNMRIEIIPALAGQDIVMRLFTIDERYLNLENIGLLEYHRQVVEEVVARPHGLMLVVGPTGSGKTSTLYSILKQMNSGHEKIITLEDPVEYEIKGITQLPIDTSRGESFAQRLRSVVREDPDIIMVGEIRDADTAVTALQASLTGHFVLSTFHANSAAAALSRIADMIGHNAMLASAIRLVMAQRLVRRVCPDCRQVRKPDNKELEEVFMVLSSLPDKLKKTLQQPKLYTAQGCKQCLHTGYRGRVAVAEQLVMNDDIAQLVTSNMATTQQLEQAAVSRHGMIAIIQDALLKAIMGWTTIDEVYRVLGKPDNIPPVPKAATDTSVGPADQPPANSQPDAAAKPPSAN